MMKNEVNPEEVKQEELEQTAGGKPGLFDGILMFGAWVACGFNHHYKYTGKTKTDIDGLFHVKFYQRICQDCQHEDWTRKALQFLPALPFQAVLVGMERGDGLQWQLAN